jgi:peptidoglycan-associated lipoprotein
MAALSVSLVLALVLASGCAKKKKDQMIELEDVAVEEDVDAESSGEGLPDVALEDLIFTDSGLQTVYFDYDSHALRPDALATLKSNADMIEKVPSVIVQVEGHCDERGTQEYNFALGERRALAVRQYLMKLGVPGSRIVTISYGEEDPAVPGSNESAWAKNRRCEFNKATR